MGKHFAGTAWLDKHGLTPRQRRFVLAYLNDPNATQAARIAGYSKAAGSGSKQLKQANVKAAVAAGQKLLEKRMMAEASDVVSQLTNISFADASELSQIRRGACRYCWGEGHGYHWRTPEEMREAVKAELDKLSKELDAKAYGALFESALENPALVGLSADGGYGYLRSKEPNEDCPMCEGDGVAWVHMADTRDLTDRAAALFDGVEETRQGVKIRHQDRSKHLEALAKHLGVYKEAEADTHAAAMSKFRDAIHGAAQAVPIATKENAPANQGEGATGEVDPDDV